MRNFYRQGPPPVRPYQHYHGPGRMQGFGYPPPHRFNPGMMPPPGPKAPSKIESFMETCNRLLSTAQGFQPYFAQATPLIRNIPALWRLYRGFSSSPKGNEHEDLESSEFNLDSSSFEYVYKDDVKEESSSKHLPKNNNHRRDVKHRHEKVIRHKFDYDQRHDNHHRGANRHHQKTNEKKLESVAIEKLAKPYKTKPSVPRIFQPPYHFDE